MVRDPFFHLWESNGWLHSLQNLAYNKITELTETGIMIVMKENQDRNIQNVYRQIVEISKKYQVKKVVLFGSRARGTNMPKSDIDLAIYGCADFGGLSDSLNEDLWSLLKLDIINMDDKYVSSELVSEIEKDGVVLYEKV